MTRLHFKKNKQQQTCIMNLKNLLNDVQYNFPFLLLTWEVMQGCHARLVDMTSTYCDTYNWLPNWPHGILMTLQRNVLHTKSQQITVIHVFIRFAIIKYQFHHKIRPVKEIITELHCCTHYQFSYHNKSLKQ